MGRKAIEHGSGATADAPKHGGAATRDAPRYGRGATRDAPRYGRGATTEPTKPGRGARADELICVVEIPKGARNKYEYDPALGGFRFARLLMTAATYPADYGFLLATLGLDGDPLDALVLLYEPTFPGCLISVRALGVFRMSDEHGPDDKIICVPDGDPYWSAFDDVAQLPAPLRAEIEQFFGIYKQLEPGRCASVHGWGTPAQARAEIAQARARHRAAPAA
jgi:inorganic pyrophosphatase